MTEDEMVGWYYQLNGREFEQLQDMVMDREAWSYVGHGVTESDTTEQLNTNNGQKNYSRKMCHKTGGRKKANKKTTNQPYNLSQNELKDKKKKKKKIHSQVYNIKSSRNKTNTESSRVTARKCKS